MAAIKSEECTPLRRALLAWRQVAGLAGAGVAKAHGQNRHLAGVIKRLCAHAHPLAQAFAAGIVKGHTALVHFATWRLTHGFGNVF